MNWIWWAVLIIALIAGFVLFTARFRNLGRILMIAAFVLMVVTGIVQLANVNDGNGAAATITKTPTASESSTPSATPSDTEEDASADINAEAANWVRLIVQNFKGVTMIPKRCQNWTPEVDLAEAHFYYKATNKESNTAFGPAMGTRPCEIAINLVERSYRDSMLLLDIAKRRGLIDFNAGQMASKVKQYHDGPFADRQVLANRVLGWYADSSRVLTMVRYEGGYLSNVVSTSNGTPVTKSVRSTKTSDVLVASNRKTGKIESMDRTNCGHQDFKPDRPIYSPPPRKPKPPKPPENGGGCAPGECTTTLDEKDYRQGTQYQGNNKPGGGGKEPGQTDPVGPPKGGNPPPSYTQPSKPQPTQTTPPRPTPTQTPQGGDDSGNNDNTGDPGEP